MVEFGNIEVEEVLLGHVFYYRDSFDQVKKQLTPDDFYFERTREIFRAILDLSEQGKPIEIIEAFKLLSNNGGLKKIGGKHYLASLVAEERIGSSQIIPHLINEIKGSAKARNLNFSLLHAQDKLKAGESTEEVIAETNTDLDELKEKATDFFPNVMDGVAGKFAHVYSSYLEVPKHFFYMAFLTCLGNILADKVKLVSELDTQPRLFTVLLGESADDRKSTALIKVVNFFKETMEHFAVCWGVGSAEGLQMRLKKDSNLLLCFDEFKGFINKCKIESSVLLPAVNSLFEMNIYEAHTKTMSIDIKDAHLSMLAASTVQTWERIWIPAFTDIGFYNRLWLVPGMGERKFSLPKKIPDQEKQALKNDLIDILKSTGQGIELDLTDEAKDLYQKWYIDLEQSIHTKRLDTYSMRLMSLVALNEFKDEVDIGVIKKVIALANWQLEIRRLHDPVDAENKVAKIEERIRRALRGGPRSDRNLKRLVNANREGLWFYGMATSNLRKFKEIIWDKKNKLWRLVK